MWISKDWNDYELLGCGNGLRMERWGNHKILRPDTNAKFPIWHGTDRLLYDGRYTSGKSGGHWECENLPKQWRIQYRELLFEVGPTHFKQMGLFPEQAVNWDFAARQIKNADRPIRVLNLFAYTGGATLACAKAGAEVCHVDASKRMVALAKENALKSGLGNAPIRWIVDDCLKFVEREIRRGRKYDALIMDPPAYGHGPNGEVWNIQKNLLPFIERTASLLSDSPLFVLVNTYTEKLTSINLAAMLRVALQEKFGGIVSVQELGLPVSDTNFVLPCGMTGRWSIY